MNIDLTGLMRMATPHGEVIKAELNRRVFFRRQIGYVSLGDSIAAGHSINSDWAEDYGEKSQYGVNGNTETVIVPGSYTDWIRSKLSGQRGDMTVFAKSFARSGDTVADLIAKLSHAPVRYAIEHADVVTICIGANDVLQPAMSNLGEYIDTGSVAAIEAQVEANLAALSDPANPASYMALFNALNRINPASRYVFANVYNPYKYLWADEGTNGFFGPLLATIPNIDLFGLDVDGLIKNGLLNTPIIRQFFDRVNGLGAHSERYVTRLNQVIANRIAEYRAVNPNFIVADTKSLYDTFPDRPVTAQRHYNDLVNVEYTRGYDTMQMDWGALWAGSSVTSYWRDLATDYVSSSGIDINGFAEELVTDIIERVVAPDVDPHPEEYGQYAMYRSLADALGWRALDRYTITFIGNGGSGAMQPQNVVGVDGMPAFTVLPSPAFTPATGYRFTNWNTHADGSGTAYSGGQQIPVNANITLYAQWSNIYTLTFRHTKDSALHGDGDTGPMECYALWIAGTEQADLGAFSNGARTYRLPYGTAIGVIAQTKTGDARSYITFNGTKVAGTSEDARYGFTLTGDTDINFEWTYWIENLIFPQSYWNCYITTK